MQWLYLVSIFILSYLLGKTADLCARMLRQIKKVARLNEFIIAFFILGGITSAPEIFVAIMSAAHGTPQLSLGNLLGSNIVVLSLLLGTTAIFAGGLHIRGFMRKTDLWLTLLITGLPILFVIDGFISRPEGIILLAAFGGYLWYFYNNRHLYEHRPGPDIKNTINVPFKHISLFLLAAGSLLSISYVLIEVSIKTALLWSIPTTIVGLLMISIGTNIPEVAFVFKQLANPQDRNKNIATGVLLGNVAFNTPTLGLLGLLHPFAIVNVESIRITCGLLLVTLCLLAYFLYRDKRLSQTEGALLLTTYICFVTYLITTLDSGNFAL